MNGEQLAEVAVDHTRRAAAEVLDWGGFVHVGARDSWQACLRDHADAAGFCVAERGDVVQLVSGLLVAHSVSAALARSSASWWDGPRHNVARRPLIFAASLLNDYLEGGR